MKRVVWLIIVMAILAVPLEFAYIHFKHNHEASRLLSQLQKIELPKGAHLVLEHSEVGHYLGATGDTTDILAIRVFACEKATEEILQFADPRQNPKRDFGIFNLSDKPPLECMPISLIRSHCAGRSPNLTFVLYAVDRCQEDGLWDPRGW